MIYSKIDNFTMLFWGSDLEIIQVVRSIQYYLMLYSTSSLPSDTLVVIATCPA